MQCAAVTLRLLTLLLLVRQDVSDAFAGVVFYRPSASLVRLPAGRRALLTLHAGGENATGPQGKAPASASLNGTAQATPALGFASAKPLQPLPHTTGQVGAATHDTLPEVLSDWLGNEHLTEIFEDAPRSSPARSHMHKLFEDLSEQGSNATLAYETLLSFVLLLWQGRLSLPKQNMQSLYVDAASFLLVLDRDRDGAVSLDEFIEFMASLVQVVGPETSDLKAVRRTDAWSIERLRSRVEVWADNLTKYSMSDPVGRLGSALSAWTHSDLRRTRLLVLFRKIGDILLELSDSIDMLSQDIKYSSSLLKNIAGGENLSELQMSLLRRTASDALTLVPSAAIAMMPLPFIGHVLLFSLIKTCAPQLLPSPFSPSRLELVQAWQQVRRHPEYKAWSLYGAGPSEKLDAALLSIFEAEPGSSARAKIRGLFEEMDSDGSGNITQSQVLNIVQAMWVGKLNLPTASMEDFRLDASALGYAIDRRDAGCLTLGEFTEYIETVVEVANTYMKKGGIEPGSDGKGDTGGTLDEMIVKFQELQDSVSILLRDVSYAAHLAKKQLFAGTLSNMQQAMLKRTGKDLLTCLPYALIMLVRITPAVKLFLCLLLYKNAPRLLPSAFRKPRRRFARAWKSIAVKQRIRAYKGWCQFEEGTEATEPANTDLEGILENLAADAVISKRLETLFEKYDTEGSGTLTYGLVCSIISPLWNSGEDEGDRRIECSFLDALALMTQIAHDRDGSVTKVEFVEFLETLLASKRCKVAGSVTVKESGRKLTMQEQLSQRLSRLKELAKQEVRDLGVATSGFVQDIAFAASLLRRPRGGTTFSKTEQALMKRTAKDILLFVPVGLIIVAPLTPVGTALTISLMKRFLPSCVPSAFRKARIELRAARPAPHP